MQPVIYSGITKRITFSTQVPQSTIPTVNDRTGMYILYMYPGIFRPHQKAMVCLARYILFMYPGFYSGMTKKIMPSTRVPHTITPTSRVYMLY